MIKDPEFLSTFIIPLENVNTVLQGVINTKKELDSQILNGDINFTIASKLAIKYWTLLSNIDECYSSAKFYSLQIKKQFKIRKAVVCENVNGSEALRIRMTETDSEYIELNDCFARAELLVEHISNIKEEVKSAHYLMKTMYEKEVDVFLSTPKTN